MKYSKFYINYKITQCMKKFGFISNVLEVGCGTGEVLDLVSKEGYKIKGIDLSPEAISICKQKSCRISNI